MDRATPGPGRAFVFGGAKGGSWLLVIGYWLLVVSVPIPRSEPMREEKRSWFLVRRLPLPVANRMDAWHRGSRFAH
jgi:hypothetical protein